MDADRKATERANLERWIADSLRLRHRLALALPAVIIAALIVVFIDRTPGLIALVIGVSTIGIGLYITTAHVADWRGRLVALDDTRSRVVGLRAGRG